jgi:hypothetical protein
MKTKFYILMSLQTLTGFVNYGQFWLGHDGQVASEIFNQLKDSAKDANQPMLHLDFMECVDEIPVKIKTVCCTLDDFMLNCKTIAKETFRRLNLENGRL